MSVSHVMSCHVMSSHVIAVVRSSCIFTTCNGDRCYTCAAQHIAYPLTWCDNGHISTHHASMSRRQISIDEFDNEFCLESIRYRCVHILFVDTGDVVHLHMDSNITSHHTTSHHIILRISNMIVSINRISRSNNIISRVHINTT